ncbi:bifunctional DNA primase/polymerase [Streptomyces sp. NPDC047981]|uniref:bifunctional DNA primase/polymerase n=1 Tax=Streptomyces sp. NPDC047981 TaxID=3154610 RepID=UPI00341658F2
MTHAPRPALLSAALDAAERGWPVFPLRPSDKRPAGHSAARCPGTGRCADGHLVPEQRATTNPDLIRAAWTMRPYNVGIATGPAGLLVVDLDTLKLKDEEGTPDGATSFKALCERAGQPVPATYRVRTASGGEHLYFTAPAGVRLRSTAGTLARKIDTRGWGGYVVAPGSILPSGAYEVIDATATAPLPDWLANALRPAQRAVRAVPEFVVGKTSAYATAALRNECHNVATSADGTRNSTLLRAARALGRLIATGDLDRSEVEQALSSAATVGGSESQRYYDDVITRALNWSIAHNPTRRPA